MIRSAVVSEKPNVLYNEKLSENAKLPKEITDEQRKMVVEGISHYNKVEKQFNGWVRANKEVKDPAYPEVVVQRPMDDFNEYSSDEQW